ncbi:MAG TPA: hypothetical protein VHO84_08860 [Syntrophorhabdaceae bacterium]|nr:hypothetical protein [Syntrophorhabdaceae bacterium]
MKNETRIIVYAREDDRLGDRFKKMLPIFSREEDVKLCGLVSELSAKLHVPQAGIDIAVLFPSDKDDLQNIINLRSLFENIRIILVLPDRDSETIRMGHVLHPRHLGFKDDLVSDMVFVLIKMIEVNNAYKMAAEVRA